jgi:hypothetical protein
MRVAQFAARPLLARPSRRAIAILRPVPGAATRPGCRAGVSRAQGRPLKRLRCAPALRVGPLARGYAAVTAAPLSGRGRETVLEVYDTTLACIQEIKRGMLVRRLVFTSSWTCVGSTMATCMNLVAPRCAPYKPDKSAKRMSRAPLDSRRPHSEQN